MPCLADVIDCLLCGTRTDCVQVHINDEAPPEKGQDKWSKKFCQLLSLKDDTLEDKLYDSFYCVTCSCKIKSISSISSLIENMKTKLSEIRTAIEDDLYLSNPHLFGGGDDDENTEPGERNKNQNALRAEMISAVEAVKRSALEPKKCDAGVLTEPVIIIEENELNDLKKRAANGDGAENDSSDQNGIVDIDDSQGTPTGQESKKQRQRQLIKIRINSDSVSEDIINTLRLQSGSGSSQTRQLIIRGYREIEVPQPVKSRSKASDGKSPICIDLDNEADISIAQNQNQTPVQQQLQQTAIVPDENLSATPTPTSKRRGRPSAKDNASKTKTSSKSKPRKSKAKSKSVQCPVCDVDCESTTDRRHHVEMTHKQGEVFVCPHCGGAYATERKLFNHQKVHLKPEESEEEEEEEEIGREADGESEMEGGGNEYFANDNNGNEEYAEDDEEEEEEEDEDYIDNDDDDEDWTDMEPAVKKTSRGRKSTVDKDTSRNSSKSKSQSKSSQFVDESPENIEVELVDMNPEDHSDFLMDQYHSSSIPQPSQGRKSNKRKSSQIPRAAEEALLMNSGAKRPKMATNSPVIKVASNKKVVGLPEIQQSLTHGTSQASGSENESNSSGASPRKSGRLRPKFRQYFY